MKLKEFIDYNHICPICNNKLTLFMQWSCYTKLYSNRLFKSVFMEDKLMFDQYDYSNSFKSNPPNPTICFDFNDHGFLFNSDEAEKVALLQEEVYLYYLCQPNGVKGSYDDYEINLYNGCYYRSTQSSIFKKDKDYLFLSPKDNGLSIINRDENYAIKHKINDLEKIYLLSLNNIDNKTLFWQYSVTDEQMKDEKYQPTVFEKELPLIKCPDLSSDDYKMKFINKMDSWILMS